jgi:cyclopropane fatty-acyl-phospholipid synthase-like methyltransferase
MRVIQDLQTIDKETEQLIKRIERAVRAAKLRRLSLEESWRRNYQLYLQMCEQEAELER